MNSRGRVSLPVLIAIATAFGASSTMQAYWLARVSGVDEPMRLRLLILNLIYADIDWCEAQGNYVLVHVGAQEHLVRGTMGHLESELDPQQFVRIHRSTIVNVDRIQEMQSSCVPFCARP